MNFLLLSFAVPAGAAQGLSRQTWTPFFVTGAAAFATAVVLALILTAVVRKWAPRFRLIDQPDNHRKLHRHPIPLGGGLAIYLSTVVVLSSLMTVANPWAERLLSQWRVLAVFAAAGAVIVIVGLLDDRFRIQGRVKLLGQCLAALIVACGGMNIHAVSIFGYSFNLGWLAIPFTMVWLLGAINSVNLLDGIDGLATVLGLIMVITISLMSILLGRVMEGLIALVFAGSLLGFLRFNFPPASIFLGDAGSMLIGLVVGALAVSSSLKGPSTLLLAAPLAVWTIPFLDSLAAILRRRLTGRSIYTTDRGHLHHRLLDLLGTNQRVLAVVAAFCLLTSSSTLLSMFYHNDLIAILACSAIVVILVASGIFGRTEFSLVADRLRTLGHSLLESHNGRSVQARHTEIRLQGTKPWELLLESLILSAEECSLTEIYLNVNAPRTHEGYHARWEYPLKGSPEQAWRLDIPLVVQQQSLGHLILTGQQKHDSLHEDMQQVLILLHRFEAMLQVICEGQSPDVSRDSELAKSLSSQVSAAEEAMHHCPK